MSWRSSCWPRPDATSSSPRGAVCCCRISRARGTRMRRPPRRYDYEDDGAAIYVDSFATIRRESGLSGVPADAEKVAVRMIHGTGQTDLVDDLVIHPRLVSAARAALNSGAPILTDAHMVASGVTRARLPRDNEVLCALHD